MRRRGQRILTISVISVLGLVGACADEADGDLSEREQAYADAFAEDMVNEDDDGFDVTADEAGCLSEAILQELGDGPFVDADLEPEDISDGDDTPGELLGAGVVSDDQAEAIAEAWNDCTDFEAALAGGFGAELELADDTIECLADAMRDEDTAAEFVRIAFTEGDEAASEPVIRDIVRMSTECSGVEDSPLVQALTESFAADGSLDEEQAHCVALGVVDDLGLERLLEITSGTGDFEDAPPEVQSEMTRAVLDATVDCGIPLDQLSGP